MGREVKVVVLCSLLWAGQIQADEARLYTPDECIRRGLAGSGTASNARLDEKISRQRIRQARSQALPHLSLAGNYTHLDELQTIEFGGEQLEMGTLENYSVEANIRQTLLSGGKVTAALRAAAFTKEYSEWTRKEIESELAWRIRRGINAVLLASASADVYEDSVKQLAAFLKEAEDRNRAGKASDFDVLTARVRMLNESPELLSAKNALDLALEDLRITAALDDGPYGIDAVLEFKAADISLEEAETYAVSNRPACTAMRALAGLKAQDIAAARAAGMPALDAFFTYNGANSYRFVSFQDEWQWHWSAGLVMSWNVWDGDLNRGIVAEKKLEHARALTDLDEMRKNVRLSVRRMYREMKHAEELVKAARENVGLAQRALDIAVSRNKSGLSTYIEFTDANLALRKAQLMLMSGTCSHMNALAGLDHVTGGMLSVRKAGGAPRQER